MIYIIALLFAVIAGFYVAYCSAMSKKNEAELRAKREAEIAEAANRVIERKLAQAIAVKSLRINQEAKQRAEQETLSERANFDKDGF